MSLRVPFWKHAGVAVLLYMTRCLCAAVSRFSLTAQNARKKSTGFNSAVFGKAGQLLLMRGNAEVVQRPLWLLVWPALTMSMIMVHPALGLTPALNFCKDVPYNDAFYKCCE